MCAVLCDAETGYPRALPCETKAMIPYAGKATQKWIAMLRFGKFRVRSDQENAAGAWVDEIVKLFPEQAKEEFSPKHSSASNPAERHIQNVEKLAITLRMSVVE